MTQQVTLDLADLELVLRHYVRVNLAEPASEATLALGAVRLAVREAKKTEQ